MTNTVDPSEYICAITNGLKMDGGAPVRNLYGTCFYIGDNYFLTAGHVIEYARSVVGNTSVVERQESPTGTTFHQLKALSLIHI